LGPKVLLRKSSPANMKFMKMLVQVTGTCSLCGNTDLKLWTDTRSMISMLGFHIVAEVMNFLRFHKNSTD